jgi:hypothetical protein
MNEEDIQRFVAPQTGLSLERATRILKLGEPWPFVKAFGELYSRSSSDAKEASVPFDTALRANAALVEMGVDSLGAEAIDRHIARTADLSGEEDETVEAVQLALHACFRLMMENVEKFIKKSAR